MEKIGRKYLGVFSIISFISFLWIFLVAAYQIFIVNSISVFISVGCCAVIFLYGRKSCLYLNEDKLEKLYFILRVLSFLFMLYIAWNLRASIYSTWDYGAILNDSIQIAKTNNLERYAYYARYPNNLLLLFILEKVFRIVLIIVPDISVKGLQSCSIILSFVCVQLAISILYITLRQLWGKKKASLTGIVLLGAVPLYLYATFAYTDTLSLPLVVGQVYLYAKFKSEGKGKERWLFLILGAILGAIGFKLKMTIAFVLIAIIINIFIQGDLKIFIKSVALICVTGVITIFLMNSVLLREYKIGPELKDQYQFPYAHWVMMMLNDSGGYNQEDVDYTESFDSYKEKNEADIYKIKERIKSRGIAGTIKHIFGVKILRTWGLGSMGGDDYIARLPAYKNPLQSIFCQDGKYHNVYLIYVQSYHLLMLFWIAYYLLVNIRIQEKQIENVVVTSVWGLAAFLCIWECNSRYLVQMLPLLVLVMMSGIYKFLEKSKEEEK